MNQEKLLLVRKFYANNPEFESKQDEIVAIGELLGLRQTRAIEKYIAEVKSPPIEFERNESPDMSFYSFRLLTEHGTLRDLECYKVSGSTIVLK